jgi:peptidoglycan/xylan/chitin deacetylase (PgdA/CDA1 family)
MALPDIDAVMAACLAKTARTAQATTGGLVEANHLLGTLQRYNAPAMLFICSKWIDANPGRTEQLAANPLFEIGNHGTRHVPLSVTVRSAYGIAGTKSASEAVDEVWTNQNRIAALTGTAPSWFRRPRTTTTSPYRSCTSSGSPRFSVNADNGATSPAGKVGARSWGRRRGRSCWPMNHPASGTSAGVATRFRR